MLEIGAQAALVAVVHGEVAAARTLEPPGVVAAGRLHLEHVGAQVRQNHPCGRPHHHVRELDNAQPVQGPRWFQAMPLADRGRVAPWPVVAVTERLKCRKFVSMIYH